jgi:hypothetical protein
MKELLSALIRAKANITPPVKNRKAMYGRYADLDAVLKAVEPPLAAEGLVIVQSGMRLDGVPHLRTYIYHSGSGESIHSDIPLVTKDPNDPQKVGGSITYARRYGISAILSLVADDDDDGNTAAGNHRDGAPKLQAKPQIQKPQAQSEFPKAEGNPEALAEFKQRADALVEKLGLKIQNPLPDKMIDALWVEFQRSGVKDSGIIPEIRAVVKRDLTHIAELTEAEAKTVAIHLRRVRAGDAQLLGKTP